MFYVDENYYKTTYVGEFSEEPRLKSLLSRASRQIDSMTYNRIVGIGFDNLTEFQKSCIKEAICLQVDFVGRYGEYIDTPLSGYSINGTSLSFNTESLNGVTTTREIVNILKQTGLTCRRI